MRPQTSGHPAFGADVAEQLGLPLSDTLHPASALFRASVQLLSFERLDYDCNQIGPLYSQVVFEEEEFFEGYSLTGGARGGTGGARGGNGGGGVSMDRVF